MKVRSLTAIELNNTVPFYNLIGENRFLYNNCECVKLEKVFSDGEYPADDSYNAVSLDKGELIFVKNSEEVIDLVRSY